MDTQHGHGAARKDSKPDGDSLMAMQALLTIRKESVAESDSGTTKTKVDTNTASSPTKAAAKVSKPQGSLAALGSPASQHEASKAVVKSGATLVPARHALPPQGNPFVLPSHAPVRYGPNLFHHHGFGAPPQARNSGFSGFRVVLPQATTVTPSPTQMTIPSVVTARSQSTTSNRKRKKSVAAAKSATKDSNQAASPQVAEQAAVRREQIEAALRSKPQRGRKRENLSAEERLELTRTRNREHAKSTRIKKKARFQELLDKEQEYNEILAQRDLASRRRQCIFDFVSFRSRMLNILYASMSGTPSQAPAAGTSGDGASHRERTRVVSFADGLNSVGVAQQLSGVSQDPSTNVEAEFSARLFDMAPTHLLHNPQEFQLEQMGISPEQAQAGEGTSIRGVAAMEKVDRELLAHIQDYLGQGTVPSVSYGLRNPKDGVVVDNEGTGFAEVDVTLKVAGESEMVVKSLIFKLSFATDSRKIASARWSELHSGEEEKPSLDDGRYSSSSSAESSLGWQTSHPSVVSLDQGPSPCEPSGEKTGQKDSEGGNGPGMNI